MLRSLAPTIGTIVLMFLINFTAAGNTTCAGNMTQWYTDAVGETACVTYQRLRQICNSDYQVPNFRPNTPGDQCDDQLQSCCCNSISWALSMLCMNCQWDVDGGSATGIDAGIGAYQLYSSPSGPFCSPGTNQSLPSDIQAAVCNTDIKLGNFLYDLFWSNGAWFYVYTMETAVKDEAATNNNMYTHCNSTTSSTLSSSASTSASTSTASAVPSQTTTAAPAGSAQRSNVPVIVGAVIGSIVALVVAVIVARLCWRKRRRSLVRVSLNTDSRHAPAMTVVSPYTVTNPNADTTLGNPTSHGFEYARKRGHLPSDFSSTSPSTTGLVITANQSGQSSSDLLQNTSSTTSMLRHEDAGALIRSGSGRLPPAYDPGWDVHPGEPSRLNPDSEYQAHESPLQVVADSEPSLQRTKR